MRVMALRRKLRAGNVYGRQVQDILRLIYTGIDLAQQA